MSLQVSVTNLGYVMEMLYSKMCTDFIANCNYETCLHSFPRKTLCDIVLIANHEYYKCVISFDPYLCSSRRSAFSSGTKDGLFCPLTACIFSPFSRLVNSIEESLPLLSLMGSMSTSYFCGDKAINTMFLRYEIVLSGMVFGTLEFCQSGSLRLILFFTYLFCLSCIVRSCINISPIPKQLNWVSIIFWRKRGGGGGPDVQ